MTEDDLGEIVRAVALSEEAVDDLRIVQDEREGLLAVGIYQTARSGPSVLVLHLVHGARPVRLRIAGAHRLALLQALGYALEQEEE